MEDASAWASAARRLHGASCRYGDDTPLGVTRRVLLTGAHSLAPNAFVLGIDAERDVMIVHELVTRP